MDKIPTKSARCNIFTASDPFDQRMMDVGEMAFDLCRAIGNPAGYPVVGFARRPRGGGSPVDARYLIRKNTTDGFYFDQRGCGAIKRLRQ